MRQRVGKWSSEIGLMPLKHNPCSTEDWQPAGLCSTPVVPHAHQPAFMEPGPETQRFVQDSENMPISGKWGKQWEVFRALLKHGEPG